MRPARGTVLIITLWVTLVLSGLALVFARSTRVTVLVSANHRAGLEAQCLLEGAQAYVLSTLPPDPEAEAPDYEAVPLGSGYLWCLRPDPSQDQEPAFGPSDEAAKINLNTASLEMLLKLPGMSAELAASIIDWRDDDEELTPGGAESETYLLLPEPYTCKNAPLESVDEILLIKEGSAEQLYGTDTNRNGIDDEDEASTGPTSRGFYDYVTVYSVEANTDSEGRDRINVNDNDTQALSDLLQETLSDSGKATLIVNAVGRGNFSNIFAFYQTAANAGMTREEFTKIADRLTTTDDKELPGLVNINTAPPEVLVCLPGLEDSDVDALVAHRGDGTDEALTSVAWILEVLDLDKAVAIGAYITTRSQQYTADLVAVSGNGRAFRRAQVVFDLRDSAPGVRAYRDLTALGWPLAATIRETLRAGEPLEN